MDPTTIGLGAVTAYLAKDGLNKLLGPTAEYLGEGIKELTAKRMEAVGKIFNSAELKLKDDINKPGVVPPKVLSKIINEGSYSDDAISIDYFGGVLASSRTTVGRDDRGATYARLISSLSSYQMRTHYLFYSTIRDTFKNHSYKFDLEDRGKMQLFVPYHDYFFAMDFSKEEENDVGNILNHTLFGLYKEDLISSFLFGNKDKLVARGYGFATSHGICFEPTALGADLLLWASGASRGYGLHNIFDDSFSLQIDGVPARISNCIPKPS